jgi:hypothetical protein
MSFIVEVLDRIGKPPVRISASQVVIRLPDGTPVSVAAVFGTAASVLVSHCADANFNENLKKLGINETTVTDIVRI